MRNGETVAAFEREFAAFVGAKYAIAACNGTVTLQAALVALGVKAGDRVAVPPLTMSATTMAVLNVGAVPVFRDVRSDTWTMDSGAPIPVSVTALVPVSLYGLHYPLGAMMTVDDAAQTLRPHNSGAAFTSYSFQASKILSTGEGGMLVTNDEALAAHARSYLSLGYDLKADQPRINPDDIKASTYVRHVRGGINGRMNDITAELGLKRLAYADALKAERRIEAVLYREAIAGCDWLTPQYVPEGWTHDYWAYAIACQTPEDAKWLQRAVVMFGGEMPYAAWRLTYHEPAFRHLARDGRSSTLDDGTPLYHYGICPVAESLQPRLLQFQTNDFDSAKRNANALRRAISEAPTWPSRPSAAPSATSSPTLTKT